MLGSQARQIAEGRDASVHPAYQASEGAVRIYSKAAAARYGPSGVKINTVHAGYMRPMLNATNAGKCADKTAMTPLGRIGKPIELAYGALLLASEEASFITGGTCDRRRLYRTITEAPGE